MRPIGVDLFAGAGGMSLGFEQAGFDVLAAVEVDPIHCAVHEFNFPNCAVFCHSVTTISGAEIRNRSTIQNREIDVVFGGPPCQGFSLIGKRLLDDDRNQLVFHFIRLVEELQPRYFVMENVKGMATGKHKQLLEEVMQKFESLGYQIQKPYQILNAMYYGVPQDRERLFLLGARADCLLPNYPQPQTKPAKTKRKLAANLQALPIGTTVNQAISDLPTIEKIDNLWKSDQSLAEFSQPSQYAAVLRELSFVPSTTSRQSKNAADLESYPDRLPYQSANFAYPRQYNPQLLTASLRTQHSAVSQQRFANTLPGTTEPISRFFKLDLNGICNTLRAGTPSGRGAFTSPRPIHPIVPRCITVREAARLHSYPDWFRFHVTKWHGFRQIGNSVPPFLGRAVAQEIMQCLGRSPVKPTQIQMLGSETLLSFTMSEAALRYDIPFATIPQRLKTKSSQV